MSNPRVFFGQVNRAFDANGAVVTGARARFYANETSTLLTIYDGDGAEMSQPVEADANGVFPSVYVTGSTPIRVAMFDEDDVVLPGYPLDDIVPLATDATNASSVAFEPTEALPFTNVQDAIVGAGELSTDQTDIITRSFTPWLTGGTANDYTITPSPAITAYAAGQAFLMRPDRASTGAATVNVNGLGTRNILKLNNVGVPHATEAGDIRPRMDYLLTYDGTQFVISLGRIPNAGSDSNGQWWRDVSGVQFCWKNNITLARSSAKSMTYFWTLPGGSPASAVLVAHVILSQDDDDYSNCAVTDFGAPMSTSGTSGVTVGFWRCNGGTNFPTNATVANCRAFAIMRWF